MYIGFYKFQGIAIARSLWPLFRVLLPSQTHTPDPADICVLSCPASQPSRPSVIIKIGGATFTPHPYLQRGVPDAALGSCDCILVQGRRVVAAHQEQR